jgi:CMP-N-acetylneuraminic acid synthetase
MRVLVIIPAKTDSTRLKKKNLRIINGKTLVEHSIDYVLRSEYVKDIIVSTESDEVRKICSSYDEDIIVLDRPPQLLKDAEVADVYVDIVQNQYFGKATHVVGIQPDHPDRTIDLDKMLEYFVENKYDDLVTVDSKGTRNGSIRIVKFEHVSSGCMSRRVGSLLDDCTNIHNEEDLKQAEININSESQNYE